MACHLSLGRVGGPICGCAVPCVILRRQSRLAGVVKSGEGEGRGRLFGLWWLLVNLLREVGETLLRWRVLSVIPGRWFWLAEAIKSVEHGGLSKADLR
jgi:hypothetical protein